MMLNKFSSVESSTKKLGQKWREKWSILWMRWTAMNQLMCWKLAGNQEFFLMPVRHIRLSSTILQPKKTGAFLLNLNTLSALKWSRIHISQKLFLQPEQLIIMELKLKRNKDQGKNPIESKKLEKKIWKNCTFYKCWRKRSHNLKRKFLRIFHLKKEKDFMKKTKKNLPDNLDHSKN